MSLNFHSIKALVIGDLMIDNYIDHLSILNFFNIKFINLIRRSLAN